jgi:hypothetical protein
MTANDLRDGCKAMVMVDSEYPSCTNLAPFYAAPAVRLTQSVNHTVRYVPAISVLDTPSSTFRGISKYASNMCPEASRECACTIVLVHDEVFAYFITVDRELKY